MHFPGLIEGDAYATFLPPSFLPSFLPSLQTTSRPSSPASPPGSSPPRPSPPLRRRSSRSSSSLSEFRRPSRSPSTVSRLPGVPARPDDHIVVLNEPFFPLRCIVASMAYIGGARTTQQIKGALSLGFKPVYAVRPLLLSVASLIISSAPSRLTPH
jgi:hypothetical protein